MKSTKFKIGYAVLGSTNLSEASVGLQLKAVFSRIYGFKTSFPRVSVWFSESTTNSFERHKKRTTFAQVFIPQYSEEELAIMQRQAEIAEKVN
jgi:hypothetical protein